MRKGSCMPMYQCNKCGYTWCRGGNYIDCPKCGHPAGEASLVRFGYDGKLHYFHLTDLKESVNDNSK